MEAILTIFALSGTMIYHLGLMTVLYYPLALWYELRQLWPRPSPRYYRRSPLVSVIVPAYNEAKVIDNCIRSILACQYRHKELILIDDGSRDATLARMRQYEGHPKVTVIAKPNGGKASALNAGIAQARGEVLFFVDADGMFAHNTITAMLAGFENNHVGAVCGNDTPVNLDRPQTHLLSLMSRVGTGFVRRALALLNCLPIVSGNMGAFRRDVIEQIGPFREGFIGEDLELTWRVHRAGFRVNFQPQAVVYAEVPSTIQGLWKQRVRWARGLLQTVRLHRDMLLNWRYGAIGFFLPINIISMVLMPLVQLAALLLLPLLALLGSNPLPGDLLAALGWLGIGTASLTALYAIALDRAWGELRHLYVLPLWVPCTLFLNVVMLWALVLELRGSEAHWNKLERTGVVSRR